jgi:predicted DNA-binding transcriptional regulator AlpA
MSARWRGRELEPRLLSRDQVAEYLQCAPGTVDQLVDDGLIPAPEHWRGLVRWDRIGLDEVIDRVYGRAEDGAQRASITEAIDGRTRARALRRGAAQ